MVFDFGRLYCLYTDCKSSYGVFVGDRVDGGIFVCDYQDFQKDAECAESVYFCLDLSYFESGDRSGDASFYHFNYSLFVHKFAKIGPSS